MNATRKIALIAIFTSLAIATDYAMAPIYNVKLVFTLVFASAYSFGFKIGATIALLTELIWGIISPNGPPTLILPFLMGSTVIYALAGWGSSKIWGRDIKPLSNLNVFIGSIMAICAFTWDTITNFGTAILLSWPKITFSKLLLYEGFGIPFMVSHELGDFVIGAALAPIIILYLLKVFGSKGDLASKKELSSAKIPSVQGESG
jgi:hypothetical protein